MDSGQTGQMPGRSGKGLRVFNGIFCACVAIGVAYCLRMLEWPCWQNPEYSYNGEMLLATHDAYHWLAGAVGFGLAKDHPMAVMLRVLADATGFAPADIAFWFPALLASLVAGIVFVWTWALGSMSAGIAAGLIASIAPGFLARTLLGYYDTDLVTLFFPLCIALGPALWAKKFVFQNGVSSLGKLFGKTGQPVLKKNANPLAWQWLLILALSGFAAWWTQAWHSVFPYLIRCNVLLLALLAVFSSANSRKACLCSSLAYIYPALAGPWGLAFPIIPIAAQFKPLKFLTRLCQDWRALAILYALAGWLVIQGDMLDTFVNQVNAYLKHSGDVHSSGAASLVFPSVAQSIIEVQDLSLAALFPYFHPWMEAAIVGFACYGLVCWRRPAALFLLPLAALGLCSARLGGRMVMFGAPIVAIGISLTAFWLGRWLLARVGMRNQAGWLVCVTLCGFLVAPFLDMIPALSQGPALNRRHAAALAQAQAVTPADATLWLWWDWGYAAHYFARRQTIADGARHGGPSLYLPAAVFATSNPRFARQIIRRQSSLGREPGDFFRDMDAQQAQALINRLRSRETPLEPGAGRQFLVVSFEMLKLGFWISNYGGWNFVTQQGGGGALSIVPQALAYNLNGGMVRMQDSGSLIFPASISVFEETGVVRRNYIQEWFDSHPRATPLEQQAWLNSRRNVNFLFNRVTDEKLAMGEEIYNSLMVQLLLCAPGDPRFAPYFKLIYDNVFARIYEVLPGPEEADRL